MGLHSSEDRFVVLPSFVCRSEADMGSSLPQDTGGEESFPMTEPVTL
jgi:hypothetical protein